MAVCEIFALQNTAVDSAVVSEVKAVGSADCNEPSSAEPTAKPLPFKDPTFMVNLSSHFSLCLLLFLLIIIINEFVVCLINFHLWNSTW